MQVVEHLRFFKIQRCKSCQIFTKNIYFNLERRKTKEGDIKRDGLILKGVLHVPQDKNNHDLLLLFEGLRGDHTHATVSDIVQVVEKQDFAIFNFDF